MSDDPFLNAFSVIGSILTDLDEVMNGLKRLETAMLSQIPVSSKAALPPYPAKPPREQANDLISYYKHQGGPKPAGLGSLLTKALEATEKAYGIDGTPATLTANILPQTFVDDLLKKRRPFKDPGAGLEHGESTHRIQWFIICTSPIYKSNCKFSPGEVYEHVGEWFFPDARGGADSSLRNITNLSMWDALVDRAGPPFNEFPTKDDLDFRNPNKFHPWMLSKAQGERHFPLLHAYLNARASKRKDLEPREYLAQKVYGTSYNGLCDEYRKTTNMSKLLFIAQNTTGTAAEPVFVVLDDLDVIRREARDPRSGVITRDTFFSKSKLRS
ncbi:MAG: hypothetical protein JO025_18990 [Verrucomicrobia bacterium]|nr:hypothetical protein [Verrucomicrobiota bacterium]